MSAFALISDLHSNIEALTAVFARIDALGIDEVGCLGDIIGYGADPVPCTELVMERCAWSIMGNHDYGLFHDLREFNPIAADALRYSRQKLNPKAWKRWFGGARYRELWAYLEGLPDRHEAHGFLFVHGSPRDPIMEYVLKTDGFLEREKLDKIFEVMDRPCFVGHTHWPGIHHADYRFDQATDAVTSFELTGEPVIVNVGSVGQPRDGDPRSCFAVVDGNRVEYHRVPYDLRRTQTKIRAAGLHPALADRLAVGK